MNQFVRIDCWQAIEGKLPPPPGWQQVRVVKAEKKIYIYTGTFTWLTYLIGI